MGFGQRRPWSRTRHTVCSNLLPETMTASDRFRSTSVFTLQPRFVTRVVLAPSRTTTRHLVVEPRAARGLRDAATPDGHRVDGTAFLRRDAQRACGIARDVIQPPPNNLAAGAELTEHNDDAPGRVASDRDRPRSRGHALRLELTTVYHAHPPPCGRGAAQSSGPRSVNAAVQQHAVERVKLRDSVIVDDHPVTARRGPSRHVCAGDSDGCAIAREGDLAAGAGERRLTGRSHEQRGQHTRCSRNYKSDGHSHAPTVFRGHSRTQPYTGILPSLSAALGATG